MWISQADNSHMIHDSILDEYLFLELCVKLYVPVEQSHVLRINTWVVGTVGLYFHNQIVEFKNSVYLNDKLVSADSINKGWDNISVWKYFNNFSRIEYVYVRVRVGY